MPLWNAMARSGMPGDPANFTASCGNQSGSSPMPMVRFSPAHV